VGTHMLGTRPGANISNLRYSNTKFFWWLQQRQAALEPVNSWSCKQLVELARMNCFK